MKLLTLLFFITSVSYAQINIEDSCYFKNDILNLEKSKVFNLSSFKKYNKFINDIRLSSLMDNLPVPDFEGGSSINLSTDNESPSNIKSDNKIKKGSINKVKEKYNFDLAIIKKDSNTNKEFLSLITNKNRELKWLNKDFDRIEQYENWYILKDNAEYLVVNKFNEKKIIKGYKPVNSNNPSDNEGDYMNLDNNRRVYFLQKGDSAIVLLEYDEYYKLAIANYSIDGSSTSINYRFLPNVSFFSIDSKNGSNNFISKSGDVIVSNYFQYIEAIDTTFLLCTYSNKNYLFNFRGQQILNFPIKNIYDYRLEKEHAFEVSINCNGITKYFLMNKFGKIKSRVCDEIKKIYIGAYDYYLVSNNGLYGLYDLYGKLIEPMVYSKIEKGDNPNIVKYFKNNVLVKTRNF